MKSYKSIGTITRLLQIIFAGVLFGPLISYPFTSFAEEVKELFTIESTIETALKVNLDLKVSEEETQAAQFVEKAQKTTFYPTFNTSYSYRRNDSEKASSIYGLAQPEDLYAFSAGFTQPIFTGFSLLNQYKIASIGLDIAKIKESLTRQDIVLEAKKAYFLLLRAQKFLKVGEDTVTQLEAHRSVAENFYKVGMTPLNDLLKAEVELANARQNLVVAQNNLESAKANFNTLLRRSINADVELEDILDFTPFKQDIDYCLDTAEKNRFEFRLTEMEVEVAEKEISIQKKGFYPSVNLQGTYNQYGTDWDVDGGEGITDPYKWNITAVASWDFWEWGRTSYGVKEKLKRLSQARHQKEKIRDIIRLEVKQAFLKTIESEKRIGAVEKAIEQAKESLRISEERYKEQMATLTDVLDASTLLSITMIKYYDALYDIKISEASLYRAMGQDVVE